MNTFHSIGLVRGTRVNDKPIRFPGTRRSTKSGGSFDKFLKEACAKKAIKLSNHAEERMRQRQMILGQDDIAKISDAITKVVEKGGSKAAIMYRDMVFVTDVNDRAIITAIGKNEMKEHVFTGIDSAVVL